MMADAFSVGALSDLLKCKDEYIYIYTTNDPKMEAAKTSITGVFTLWPDPPSISLGGEVW